VTAVVVDGDKGVQARESAAVSGDLSSAAAAVLKTIAKGAAASVPIGIVSPAPESAAIAAAVAAVTRGLSSAAGTTTAATSSGVAAAVAETWLGAARGFDDVVYFAVGDHTAGGSVRAGEPVLGARGRAASIAWLALNPVEREDYRKAGCLEAEVAAAGIVRRLIWRIKAGDRSRVQDAVNGDLTAITITHVLQAARANDGVSISVVRDTAKYLGMAAANLVAIEDPQTLVLGGIMASAADLLLEPVRVEIGRRLPRAMIDALVIVPATLGDDAAAIGAIRFAAARP